MAAWERLDQINCLSVAQYAHKKGLKLVDVIKNRVGVYCVHYPNLGQESTTVY